ncbi:IPT/TIG domain-containing protein [Paenibacillus sp. BC26]|uniref:IPT/TIG domain-containing protein n=1 Tax=Paenibacillus sp. BC26 TaxID=1881032 RepID=UPI0008E78F2A|nr:IPT/TIG domain-containing protein [Paenibacillus sp. BC26]SFS67596.1 IPT/TIG domain-containing protein [Paenibacillus sp. BC26]
MPIGYNINLANLKLNSVKINPAANVMLAPNVIQTRLLQHKAVLESFGIQQVSALGKITISGNIVPKAGLLKPGANIVGGLTTFQAAYRVKASALPNAPELELWGGSANFLNATPFTRTPDAASSIFINDAYWAASEIELKDNTTVILKYPQKHLFIITEKLIVGKNVTFTWERQTLSSPQVLSKPATPPQVPTPNSLGGVTGTDGTNGVRGNRGGDGSDAPEIEVWMLSLQGSPIFEARGQDGGQGGKGQDGGNGGQGSKGIRAQLDAFGFCKAGSGAGGNGGRGGAAGTGGDGGNGGHGGKITLYAPQAIINQYTAGFFISVDGGTSGAGGIPGTPGAGGPGGQVGDSVTANFGSVCGSNGRTAGAPGAQGAAGAQGAYGRTGDKYSNAISMNAIEEDDFRRALLEPVIMNTSPSSVYINDVVTLEGLRFTRTDTVLIDDIAVKPSYFGDTRLQFTVPSVSGGPHAVYVKQTDGTLSNKGTVVVQPRLQYVQQNNAVVTRLTPGTTVVLNGSGFAPGATVSVNQQDMPGVRYISPTQLEYLFIRPAKINPNPSGEAVKVKVSIAGGLASNEIDLVLDTYNILVLGDSIQWGQGLADNEKIHSLVGAAVAVRQGNIGIYKEVIAHSGAYIGFNDQHVEAPKPGEVPTHYPTIFQQCDLFGGHKPSVDLILIDGGINDINLEDLLNPFNPIDVPALSQQFCHDHLKEMLLKIARDYPNAKTIVTGYYAPLSRESDLEGIKAILVALGILIGGTVAGPILGGVAGGVSMELFGNNELNLVLDRCAELAKFSRIHLEEAVDEVNATLPAKRFFFADPGFIPANSMFAPDPLLFGLHADLSPQDANIAPSRAVSCVVSGCTGMELEICKRASIGHPNTNGARAYAKAIIPLL